MKDWAAIVLSSGALIGVVAYAAEWGGMTTAVANHIADTVMHGNTQAVEQRMKGIEDDLAEHKDNFVQFQNEQGVVNTEILKSLGRIEAETERDR